MYMYICMYVCTCMYVCMYIAYCAYGFEYVENALSDLEVRQRTVWKRPQPFLKGFGGIR